MAEMIGTIPAIKERPKVAKRPTIHATPVAKPSSKEIKKLAAAIPAPAQTAGRFEPKDSKPKLNAAHMAAGPVKEPVCAVAADAVPTTVEPVKAVALAVLDRAAVPAGLSASAALAVSTIPPVRERPKVAKKPTIFASKTTGATIPAKKPLLKKKAAAEQKQQSPAMNWMSWAPVAVGIVLGFLSPQLHALAAQWDPWGLRIVFPVVQVLGLRELGMSDELTRTLPQLMLYLQFPLEGLLVAMNLRRGMRFSMAIGPIPALHFVCGLVLWIVALGSLKPI